MNLPHFKKGKGDERDPRIYRKPPAPPKEKSGRGRGRPPGSPTVFRRRPPDQRPAVVTWDLKQAARAMCPEALEFIYQTMRDAEVNRDTRLRAAQLLLERGFGRPEVTAEVDVQHRFCVAPDVMPVDLWLSRRGQPEGTGDSWLQAQQAKGGALQTAERTMDALHAARLAASAT
jgi:hypothetical protein